MRGQGLAVAILRKTNRLGPIPAREVRAAGEIVCKKMRINEIPFPNRARIPHSSWVVSPISSL